MVTFSVKFYFEIGPHFCTYESTNPAPFLKPTACIYIYIQKGIIYIYIFIHTYTHIHTYIHTYILHAQIYVFYISLHIYVYIYICN